MRGTLARRRGRLSGASPRRRALKLPPPPAPRYARACPLPACGSSRADRLRSQRPWRARRCLHELALRIRLRGRRLARGSHAESPLGEVVDALESAPRVRGDQSHGKEPLERVLAAAPVPPAGLARPSAKSPPVTGPRRVISASTAGCTVGSGPQRRPTRPATALAQALHAPAQERLQRQAASARPRAPSIQRAKAAFSQASASRAVLDRHRGARTPADSVRAPRH